MVFFGNLLWPSLWIVQGQVETWMCAMKILPVVSIWCWMTIFWWRIWFRLFCWWLNTDPDVILPNETNHQYNVLTRLSQNESVNEDGDLDSESDNEVSQVFYLHIFLMDWKRMNVAQDTPDVHSLLIGTRGFELPCTILIGDVYLVWPSRPDS